MHALFYLNVILKSSQHSGNQNIGNGYSFSEIYRVYPVVENNIKRLKNDKKYKR